MEKVVSRMHGARTMRSITLQLTAKESIATGVLIPTSSYLCTIAFVYCSLLVMGRASYFLGPLEFEREGLIEAQETGRLGRSARRDIREVG